MKSTALSIMVLAVVFSGGCAHTQSHAAATASPQLPAIEFVNEWGKLGDTPGQLNEPVGPAVDGIGRVYFANRGSGLMTKFEAGGVPLLAFDDAIVRKAAGIAVDSGGGIYVADTLTGEIKIFFPEGDWLRSFRIPVERNSQGPFAFSVDAQGNSYVPDADGGRVLMFNPHGQVKASWKTLSGTGTVAGHPTMAIAAPDGNIYVGDGRSGRVVKYSADGSQSQVFDGTHGSPAPLLSMAASDKYLFVLRDAPTCLEVWTLDGQLRLSDNLGGHLSSLTPRKATLGVNAQGDLIVLDPWIPRVLRFKLHLNAS